MAKNLLPGDARASALIKRRSSRVEGRRAANERGQKAPPTYAGHTAAIFTLVRDRLREAGAIPDSKRGDGDEGRELATALWSGAHGSCTLAVTGKLQVATQASVQRLLDVLLDRFLDAPPAVPAEEQRAAKRTAKRPSKPAAK